MTEPFCPGRSGTNAEHCWHDTGVMLTSMPPKTQEVCCYCGGYRTRTAQVFWSPAIGHGAFHPANRNAPKEGER